MEATMLFRVQVEGQANLVSRSIVGITRVTTWVMGVTNLLKPA